MLALIDADIVCYRIGFASEEETDKVAIYRAGEFMEDLVMKPYVSDYKGFLTGSNNFRMQIAKTQPYKGNRKQPKPKHYDILREYLVKAWACEVVEGQEADDAIGIQAYSMDVEDYIIMSIDKDLDMIRGNHYNFIKNNKYFVDDDEAIRHFYHQILTGDRTDNIPGLAGIGPKKADKILQDAISEKDMYEAVLKAYDNNEEYLCEQANLLWIRRESGQIWTPPK
jgi:5'-3' exonuclease